MTTTQKFEGPELAALLDQMHAALGPHARVISANRRRSGGLAGFFARESFELTVEVPGPAIPARAGAGRRRAADQGRGHALDASPSRTPSDGRSALERLIAAADDADQLAPARPGVPAQRDRSGAHRDDFATVLGRAAAEHDARLGAGHDARLDAGHDAGHDEAAGDVDPLRFTRSAEPDRVNGKTKRRIIGRRNRGRDADTGVERVIDLSAIEGRHYSSALAPRTFPGRRSPTASPVPDTARRYTPHGDVPVAALASLGVPTPWLSGSVNGRITIEGVLSRIPSPPPIIHGHGAILVFVGEPDMSLTTARAVAAALRQDPDACIFLSPGERPDAKPCVHLKAIDDLALRRSEWVQDDRVTIVAIDAGFSRQDVAWGRHTISVLHPSMRWGVVSATRKVEDVHRWARGIGGLHALAVNGMSETASPASILAAGVPVARIDGQVASGELWRKIIDDRLADSLSRQTPDLIAT